MTFNKRKKKTRQRGSSGHGWGHKKKHRGAGNRGGRGMAGTGKKGDAKKPRIWANKKYFGKYGFKKKNIKKIIKTVNVDYFEKKIDKLLSKNLIEKQGDLYIIDIEKLGFNKVLGSGKLTKKCKISAPFFSKKAIDKIKSAGGEVIQTKVKDEIKKENKPETQEKKKEVKQSK